MRDRSVILAVLASAVSMSSAAGARADDVFLENGRVISGEVETLEGIYRIRVENGVLTLRKDQVRRVEKKTSNYEIYQGKAQRIADGTAREHHLLGLWCDSQNLRRSAKKEYRLALEKDADHLGARTALGYLRIDGDWYTEEEYMLSRGFVREGSRWVSPEERQARAERERATAERRWAEEEAFYRQYAGPGNLDPGVSDPTREVEQPAHVAPRRRRRRGRGRGTLGGPVIMYTPTLVVRPNGPSQRCRPLVAPPIPVGHDGSVCPPNPPASPARPGAPSP